MTDGETNSDIQPEGNRDIHDRSTQPVDPGAQPLPVDRFPHLPNYEIFGVIGSGGQGTVYRARHRELRRTVALKVMRRGREVSEDSAERFLAEGRTAARLSHPGIVAKARASTNGSEKARRGCRMGPSLSERHGRRHRVRSGLSWFSGRESDFVIRQVLPCERERSRPEKRPGHPEGRPGRSLFPGGATLHFTSTAPSSA